LLRSVVVPVLLAASAAHAAPGSVSRVALDTPRVSEVETDEGRGGFGLFSKKAKRACLDVALIAGAIVTSDKSIELRTVTGERWRMGFKRACPALSYYQGFYYRRTQAGKLCAGRDAVSARSGLTCPIETIARIKKGK
jgi:hypothetical protein